MVLVVRVLGHGVLQLGQPRHEVLPDLALLLSLLQIMQDVQYSLLSLGYCCVASNLHNVGGQFKHPLLGVVDERNKFEHDREVGGGNDESKGLEPILQRI